MLVVDTVVGNVHSDGQLALALQAKEKDGTALRVRISAAEAQRRRLRLTSDTGVDVGVDISRGSALQDVLAAHLPADADAQRARSARDGHVRGLGAQRPAEKEH